MNRLFPSLAAALALFLALSCERPAEGGAAAQDAAAQDAAAPAPDAAAFAELGSARAPPELRQQRRYERRNERAALPMAVLQAGEFPLWFQFTEEGPALIETIEAAQYSAALIPWPHAPHAIFTLARGGELLMAVNGYGFIRLSPWPARAGSGAGDGASAGGVGLHRIPGGELWRQYTVGAFVMHDPGAPPAALLYRNDWFLYQDLPPPSPRLWTFDESLAAPLALSLPSLDAFAPEEGWNLDVLRMGGSGYWYFRAANPGAARPEIRMLRTSSLQREGSGVSLGEFHAAARPEALSAAPPLLREMLAAAFAESGAGSASVVSPAFQTERSFASGGGGRGALLAFFSPEEGLLIAATGEGRALRVEAENFSQPAELRRAEAQSENAKIAARFSLPALPEGFAYTGIGMAGGAVFASWEEQAGFSIGAAGFMAIKP